jgi:hypothetical protein
VEYKIKREVNMGKEGHSMQRRKTTEGKNLSDYLTDQDAAAVDRTLISDDSESDDEEYIDDDESVFACFFRESTICVLNGCLLID